MGEAIGTAGVMKMSGALIRASGLRRWTAFCATLSAWSLWRRWPTRRAGASTSLTSRCRAAFARYGINEADWNAIRATPPHAPARGRAVPAPVDVSDRAAGDSCCNSSTRKWTMPSSIKTRSRAPFALSGPQAGTAAGEGLRAIGLYQKFPGDILHHALRPRVRAWAGTAAGLAMGR